MNNEAKNILNKQKIELALIQHKLLKFAYVGKDLKITHRLVDPLFMTEDEDYNPNGMKAWDIQKRNIRFFSFEGIQDLDLLDFIETYNNPPEIPQEIKEPKVEFPVADDIPF